jgi:hypothetical protein
MNRFSSILLLNLAELCSLTLARIFSLGLAQTISLILLTCFALISLLGLLEFSSPNFALASLIILLILAQGLALQKLARLAQLVLLILLINLSSNILL